MRRLCFRMLVQNRLNRCSHVAIRPSLLPVPFSTVRAEPVEASAPHRRRFDKLSANGLGR
jgi:hypothetical protein